MFCIMAVKKIERDMEDVGLQLPAFPIFLKYIPFYRLKKDINVINEYLGIDVTSLLIMENVVNPFKKRVLERLATLHSIIRLIGTNKIAYNLHLFVDSIDVKIYEYKSNHRKGTLGYRSASYGVSYDRLIRGLPFFKSIDYREKPTIKAKSIPYMFNF